MGIFNLGHWHSKYDIGSKTRVLKPSFSKFVPRERNDWDATQIQTFETEKKILLQKGAIVPCEHEPGNIFLQYLLRLRRAGLPEWYLTLKV